MKINSVELMRSIRERMSQEIKGMSWFEEKEYLNGCIGSFDALLKEMPSKTIPSSSTTCTFPD